MAFIFSLDFFFFFFLMQKRCLLVSVKSSCLVKSRARKTLETLDDCMDRSIITLKYRKTGKLNKSEHKQHSLVLVRNG